MSVGGKGKGSRPGIRFARSREAPFLGKDYLWSNQREGRIMMGGRSSESSNLAINSQEDRLQGIRRGSRREGDGPPSKERTDNCMGALCTASPIQGRANTLGGECQTRDPKIPSKKIVLNDLGTSLRPVAERSRWFY